MDWFAPKHRRDPNALVDSLYIGVAPGGRTVTSIKKHAVDGDRMETTRTYGPGLPRGQSGNVGHLILGGMATTLAEMEDLAAAKMERNKEFQPINSPSEIVKRCRELIALRNEQIEDARKRRGLSITATPPAKKAPALYLPVGCSMVPTREPGLHVLARTH